MGEALPLPEWPTWPVYGLDDDLLPVLEAWHAQGRRAALAVLVQVRGSSPRPLGSEMAISDAGDVAGYLSGGCVEAAVATEALRVLASGEPVMLDYGAGSPVLDVQLTCGGRIGILVTPLADLGAYTRERRAARQARQPVDLHLDLAEGHCRLTEPAEAMTAHSVFHKRYVPPARLLLVGGDPVALALAQLAPRFGVEVALIRPYGPPEPPPDSSLTHYDRRALATALSDWPLDAFSAVYTLTHDMDDDHAVLKAALAANAFAVGALGSRRKTAERLERLRAEGFEASQLARLSSPAGHDIGAREPREIALSILAELVAARPRDTVISSSPARASHTAAPA